MSARLAFAAAVALALAAPVGARQGHYGDQPESPDTYFPPLAETVQFSGAGDYVDACQARHEFLARARREAFRDGRAIVNYRNRLLQMSIAELDAAARRLDETAPGVAARQNARDEALISAQRAFIQYARQVAAGQRVYRHAEDALAPAIARAASDYQRAHSDYGTAIERCVTRMDADEKRRVATRAALGMKENRDAWMTGIFDTGGGVMHLGPSGGTYQAQNGRMSVTKIDGEVMEGLWEQDNSGGQCPDGRHRGRFRLTFTADGFTGVFGYCEEEPHRIGGFQGKRRK